jgi:hypothetical protein
MKQHKQVFLAYLGAALLALILNACSRETPSDYLAAIYPGAGTTTAELNPEFRWTGLQDASYRFRLGTAGMETVLIDTPLTASRFSPGLLLQAESQYTWELSRGGDVLTVPFKTPGYQKFMAGEYSGKIGHAYYYDPNTTYDEWQGLLQVTVDGQDLLVSLSQGSMSQRRLSFESVIGSTVRFSFGHGDHHDSAYLEMDLMGTEVAFYSIQGPLFTHTIYTFYRP